MEPILGESKGKIASPRSVVQKKADSITALRLPRRRARGDGMDGYGQDDVRNKASSRSSALWTRIYENAARPAKEKLKGILLAWRQGAGILRLDC